MARVAMVIEGNLVHRFNRFRLFVHFEGATDFALRIPSTDTRTRFRTHMNTVAHTVAHTPRARHITDFQFSARAKCNSFIYIKACLSDLLLRIINLVSLVAMTNHVYTNL